MARFTTQYVGVRLLASPLNSTKRELKHVPTHHYIKVKAISKQNHKTTPFQKAIYLAWHFLIRLGSPNIKTPNPKPLSLLPQNSQTQHPSPDSCMKHHIRFAIGDFIYFVCEDVVSGWPIYYSAADHKLEQLACQIETTASWTGAGWRCG
jgi:hypothetical protein